ncbi:MAG TPA: transglutaminase-like domain-containing protein [Vicinamibacterales bacterium]|nr:transglutaminase-like domain-containing protein [Vicinamibacterales bacterium]
MPFSLHLSARTSEVAAELQKAMNAPGDDLAPAALAIARVEYPSLDPKPYLARLDRMGLEARARARQPGTDPIRAFNEYLYDEQGFVGNRERYDDPRNSFINEVLDRRTGIPISLAVIYLEVAHRAGLHVDGVNFPGHFLLRVRAGYGDPRSEVAIIDPFHGGARLSEYDCRQLLRQHVGDEAAFDTSLLAPATRHDIIVRILVNLKRLYVRMRSFPQARFVSTLLLGIDPSAISELRDRGLLAYHLQDFAAALRDLEEYLRRAPKLPELEQHDVIAEQEGDDRDAASQQDPDLDDATQIWEHVKTLRKRVAGFN